MQPVIIYTTSFCPDCWRVKKVLELLEVPFEERDINLDETAAAEMSRVEFRTGARSQRCVSQMVLCWLGRRTCLWSDEF